MKIPLILFFLILSCFSVSNILTGCKDDDVPVKQGNDDPGILRTDEFGNVLGGDTTDWCMHNDTTGLIMPQDTVTIPTVFEFLPAYPNPCNPTTKIRFRIPAIDTAMLYILRSSTDTAIYFKGRVMPGSYEVTIDGTEFLGTYKRVYIKSKLFSASQYCRFYGDVKFEE